MKQKILEKLPFVACSALTAVTVVVCTVVPNPWVATGLVVLIFACERWRDRAEKRKYRGVSGASEAVGRRGEG